MKVKRLRATYLLSVLVLLYNISVAQTRTGSVSVTMAESHITVEEGGTKDVEVTVEGDVTECDQINVTANVKEETSAVEAAILSVTNFFKRILRVISLTFERMSFWIKIDVEVIKLNGEVKKANIDIGGEIVGSSGGEEENNPLISKSDVNSLEFILNSFY